jgi:hypothetical protein
VLEFGFQLDSLVYTYIVHHTSIPSSDWRICLLAPDHPECNYCGSRGVSALKSNLKLKFLCEKKLWANFVDGRTV